VHHVVEVDRFPPGVAAAPYLCFGPLLKEAKLVHSPGFTRLAASVG